MADRSKEKLRQQRIHLIVVLLLTEEGCQSCIEHFGSWVHALRGREDKGGERASYDVTNKWPPTDKWGLVRNLLPLNVTLSTI